MSRINTTRRSKMQGQSFPSPQTNPLGASHLILHTNMVKTFFGTLKTLESGPNRLRLAQFDWHIGALVGVLCIFAAITPWVTKGANDTHMFLTIAGIALLIFGLIKTRRVVVTLDKAVGIAYTRIITAWGTKETAAPLSALRRSEMQHSHTDDDGRGALVLHFADREAWSVSNISAPGDDQTCPRKRINDWMHQHLPTFEQAHEDRAQDT
jgi:hypothetical protein